MMNGAEIKGLRKRLHMTQKKLAEAVGVEPNSVARWERGESRPSVDMVARLETVAREHPSGDTIIRTSGVRLDSHHGAILEALEGRLDPDLFEACAVDLLRRDYPGLVAVSRGADDGFDGAVAGGVSEQPYPLIVTTGQQLVQNLTKSIDQSQRSGWNPTRALFATSRRITPTMRRKLFDAVAERQVKLIQTYDQDWFASRLYHEPAWCKRLLGVSGRPHALSTYPITQQPVLGSQILGREREMRWLLDDHRGDCLLVGEPGSGKTFLLQSLALQGKARFLVDMDREQIANDLRSLQPPAVIVDDAHVHNEWIAHLKQIRREVRSDFRIIAVSWPGEASTVRTSVGIGHDDECTLEQIDAGTMIEIIKSTGIFGPDELLREIRKQARGRPGLAATLAHLCLVGDIRNVVSGESLVDQVASSLNSILGDDSLALLAPFALGGDSGARKDKVAEGLGKSIMEVANMLAKLAASGVILEVPDNLSSGSNWPVSVVPPRMRGPLVRRIFYQGPGSLPIDRFLPALQKPLDALETLIDARACGAPLPDLEQRLEEVNNIDLWLKYAFLGRREVEFVLDRYPELAIQLAEPSLLYAPNRIIPMLLTEGGNDGGQESPLDWLTPTSLAKSVLERLERWVAEDISDREALKARRSTLLQSAKMWWEHSRNSYVALSAMCVALNPMYRLVRSDPGMGTTFTLTERAVSAEVIDELTESWPLASHIIAESQRLPWTDLFGFIEKFWHPTLAANDSSFDAAKRLLQLVMSDLAIASHQNPGIQRRLGELAEVVGVEFDEIPDETLECLYPRSQEPFDPEYLDQERALQTAKVEALAVSWDSLSIDEIGGRLAMVEDEARLAGNLYPRLSAYFCQVLAERRSDPLVDARALMDRRLPTDLVDPFIRCATASDPKSWSVVKDCLKDETYKYVGVALAVAPMGAPPEIISAAVKRAKGIGQFIEHICIRGEVSEVALQELFRSEDDDVAIAAAVGHWQRAERRPAGASLGEVWRLAILRSADVDNGDSQHRSYWISRVLKQDSKLGTEWLVRLVSGNPDVFAYHTGKVAKKTAETLSKEQRRIVLRAISPDQRSSPYVREVVCVLVADFLDLYQELLDAKGLAYLHLTPLAGKPNEGWETKAVLALDSDYSVDEIVAATQYGMNSWSGPESEMWKGWRRAFESLLGDVDPRVVCIGKRGSEIMSNREKIARERERHEQIYGR